MFIKAIDFIFGTNFKNHETLKYIQNVNTLIVSTCTALSTLHYFTFSSYITLPYLLRLINVHCMVDLLFVSNIDMTLHHIITIGLVQFFFYKPLPMDVLHFETMILCTSELSSIFLVGREWIDKKSPYYVWNNYAFMVSFFYTRLYLLPKYLLLGDNCVQYLHSIMSLFDKCWYFGTLYAFMTINIYWGTIMIKMICSKVRKVYPFIFTYLNNEYILQYTYFLSPTIALYVYSPHIEIQWLDIAGQLLLSYNSFQYHHSLYKAIKDLDKDTSPYTINVLSPAIRPYYIADIVSIHVRTFLFSISKFVPLFPHGMITIGGLLGFHGIALHHFYDYTMEMIENKMPSFYNFPDSLFDIAIRLPIFFSLILSIIYSNTYANAHHTLMSVIMISSCLFIKPCYELNHLCLHLCLLYQSYSSCLSNTVYP